MAYSQKKSSIGPSMSDKVRIYVVGDMSVGKTSLLSVITDNKVHLSSTWTVGCNIEIKLHEYYKREFFVEFIDIGGSPKHENTRGILYSQVNGIILVHDLTNRKSLANLRKWVKEVLSSVSNTDSAKWHLKSEKQVLEFQHEDVNVPYIPVLVLANKTDLVSSADVSSSSYVYQDELGKESIFVTATDVNTFGIDGNEKLDAFLTRCIYNVLTPRPKKTTTDRLQLSPDMITRRERSASIDRQRLSGSFNLRRFSVSASNLFANSEMSSSQSL